MPILRVAVTWDNNADMSNNRKHVVLHRIVGHMLMYPPPPSAVPLVANTNDCLPMENYRLHEQICRVIKVCNRVERF